MDGQMKQKGENITKVDSVLFFNNNKDVTEDDLYGFLTYLGHEESEKVLYELGYTSWDNYLKQNKYTDAFGMPSIEVFKKHIESKLIKN